MTHDSFKYKLEWFSRLNRYLEKHYKKDEDLLVCGDFNVAPTDKDVFDPKSWLCRTYIHSDVRIAFRQIESWGLVDLFERFSGDNHSFTWWDYGDGLNVNRGMRLDHFLGSESLTSRIKKVFVDKETRAIQKSSDHAPLICSLS